MVLLLAGCDRQPLNLREQMTQNLQTLGVRAFYPLRETPRLGSLYLFDQSANPGGAGVAPYMDNEILLTDVLAAPMEAKRRATAAMKTRFVLTKATTDDDKRLGGTTDAPARYVQGDPATNQAQLATAAFPSYTLASVEQFSASAFVPAQFQSFLAALGWRSTRYVHVEAEGVEFAELPLQDMTEVIASACSQKSPPSPLTNEAMGNRLVGRSVELQQALYEERVRMATQDVSQRLSRPKPQIYLMRRIYYMRGIKFIIDDSQTTAAMLQAAINPRLSAPTATPAINVVTASAQPQAGTPAAGSSDAKIADLAAKITALQDVLKSQASGNNAQIATSYARATARGIELVNVFDRPMAFGYEPVAFNVTGTWADDGSGRFLVHKGRGLSQLCDWAHD